MKERFKDRPLSWSQISSFEYDPTQWYKRYILNERQKETPEMKFGNKFSKSIQDGKPMAPVTIYSKKEYPLKTYFNGINLVGYIDSYEPHSHLIEFKTGKREWNLNRAKKHGQINMYLLQLFIQHKVKPENIYCSLQWVPTTDTGSFEIELLRPVKVFTFELKKTMNDILIFGKHINETVEKMNNYILALKH